MRKNRRRHVNAKVLSPAVVGMSVLIVSLTLTYCCLDSKCNQLGQEIRKHEQCFESLEDERVREEARWNDKRTPEKLAQAMLRHGLEMDYPAPEQMVRIGVEGEPLPGQIALAKFRKERSSAERVAQKAGQ
ncbi:MAG: hypothetical protein PHG96_02130 [Kiritimatiellae bacterium]|nr:hypothetical protein [Kiritimatiellia bacterium]MDD3544140.1 hypothetical protein [Kiritimatiellia bacterium]MDD4024833.1 hypothetical protein [Kiritimatiellia bacterium]MDD4623094.1 hypothetical protein [Kiritimatiellia bacterium]